MKRKYENLLVLLRMVHTVLLVLVLSMVSSGNVYGQIEVINMIPNSLSNETTRDSEPNVSVNPFNPLLIAASAFTPDPAGSGNGPIYVSTNGGQTWALNVILPGGNRTVDITLRFGTNTNVLYGGILRYDNHNLNILRTSNFQLPTLMTILVDRPDQDQPYVEAATAMGGAGTGRDRVYVGYNDYLSVSDETATSERSLNAATAPAPAGFSQIVLEERSTCHQDGPSIRHAIHLDGTIYAVFFRWTACSTIPYTSDVVVVRDDNWASGASPFTALTGLDGNAGVRVVTGISIPWFDTLGTQRIGSSLAIAVDPRNSRTVYIAWADGTSDANYTIHIRRSTNGGSTWSGDLQTVVPATNPCLAINTHGTVAFLYQRLTGAAGSHRWETHLERSNNGWATPAVDNILADVPDQNGSYTSSNPIGDYAGMVSVGKNFYGVFSANNTPDTANFPSGITYQRNADWTVHQLRNLTNTANVNVSIDPFFFKVTGVAAADDFYVRDWTDSPTSGDTGLEPSTHPVFYTTSDVWNRRGTLPGSFPNDQPDNEPAGNGAGNIGDNWAFARIRRNALPASGSKVVTAHFLVSKLGTGSNYVDFGSADPDVTFIGPDPTVTFNAGDLGPFTTTAYHWHLDAVSSTHLCLAVEISASGDPYVAPSLVGTAPGWPTTDLRVINDNNKAQRNMGLSTTPARGVGFSDSFYVIAHNAATYPRNMVLYYEVEPEVSKRLKGARIEVIGGDTFSFRSGSKITLEKMQPGENRWIGFTFNPPEGKEDEILPVNFYEVVGNIAINGFTIAAQPSSMSRVIFDKLRLHRSVLTRLAACFEIAGAKEKVETALKLLEQKDIPVKDYIKFMQMDIRQKDKPILRLMESQKLGDPFGINAAVEALYAAVKSNDVGRIVTAHSSFLHKLDSFITMHQLSKGDIADILQNVRWQKDLYSKVPLLTQLECTDALLKISTEFIRLYGLRKIGNKHYPELISNLLKCFHQTAKALDNKKPDLDLEKNIKEMEQSLKSLRTLQKAHRDYLQKLQSLAKNRQM